MNKSNIANLKNTLSLVCDKANSKDSFAIEYIEGEMGPKIPIVEEMQSRCGLLGVYYYNGWGVRQSYEKAFQYSKKSCDLGYGGGCFGVGRAYRDGKGVEKDFKKALTFFTKACDLKDGDGCVEVGEFYYKGANLSKAKEFYGIACDLGAQKKL